MGAQWPIVSLTDRSARVSSWPQLATTQISFLGATLADLCCTKCGRPHSPQSVPAICIDWLAKTAADRAS